MKTQELFEKNILESLKKPISSFDVGTPNADGNPETVWINDRRYDNPKKLAKRDELFNFCSSLGLENIGKRKIRKVSLEQGKYVSVNGMKIRDKDHREKIIAKIEELFV